LYNNSYSSDGDSGSGSSEPDSPWARKLLVDALSAEEWSYLRGLFLADGYSYVHKRKRETHYVVEFYLAGNEEELARRAAGLVRRAGLKPRVYKHRRKDMWVMSTYSMALLGFLPDKQLLGSDEATRERFFDENELFGVERGLPFFSGLLDGDGHLVAYVVRKRCFFGFVNQWNWSFVQTKYPYLVDYVVRFVNSLSPGSVHVQRRATGALVASIRRCGIEALLRAGIGKYAWKVGNWQREVVEARSERAKYLNPREAAQELGLSYETVWRYLKAGKLRYVRGDGASSHHYIPRSEVERLMRERKKGSGDG
jgi:excisionase family DNA binding protein